jgi:putative hydrolase
LTNSEPNEENIEALRKFLENFLPDTEGLDHESLAKIAGLVGDQKPEELLAALQQAMASWKSSPDRSDGVDWNLAGSAAKKQASKNSQAIGADAQRKIANAVTLAELWLTDATEISALVLEAKLLTRELWVDDALPLYRALSDPIASKMSSGLSDALRENAPDQLNANLDALTSMMQAAGGAMFAMQLGQALGNLATETLTASDIGLSIFTEPRAGFLVQNLLDFIANLEVDEDAALVFFAVRELALARLFKHSRWLRDQVVSQITAYASELRTDIEGLAKLVDEVDVSEGVDLSQLMEQHKLIKERTPEQERALASIETLLALIEGWVDVVSAEATKRLPQAAAIAEAIRRRRATGGPAEKTFATLLGLELRPRQMREAAVMWQMLGNSLGKNARDDLWVHPDQLPTAADIAKPEDLVKRLQGGQDDMDQELRKLLEE